MHAKRLMLIPSPNARQNNKLPQPPAFIFLIDVSYNAVKSGMVNIVCQELKTLLDHLPRYAHKHTHAHTRTDAHINKAGCCKISGALNA